MADIDLSKIDAIYDRTPEERAADRAAGRAYIDQRGFEFYDYPTAYLAAVDVLFEKMESDPRELDRLVVPFMYNVRHVAELTIKRLLASCIYIADDRKRLRVSKQWEPPSDVVRALRTAHELGTLVAHLVDSLSCLDLPPIRPSLENLIRSIEEVEPSQFAFRYEFTRPGSNARVRGEYAFKEPKRIPVRELHQALEQCITEHLSSGLDHRYDERGSLEAELLDELNMLYQIEEQEARDDERRQERQQAFAEALAVQGRLVRAERDANPADADFFDCYLDWLESPGDARLPSEESLSPEQRAWVGNLKEQLRQEIVHRFAQIDEQYF